MERRGARNQRSLATPQGKLLAVCNLWTHPIGAEFRTTVDGEMVRTQAGRDGLALVDLALEWKQQFQGKGWKKRG